MFQTRILMEEKMQNNGMLKKVKIVVMALLMSMLLLAPLAGCTPFHGLGHGGHGIFHH